MAAGVEAGKLIKEALPNGGKIMLFVGTTDAQNAKERMQGIKQELTGSKVEIIDVRTDDTDRVRAQKNVEDTLVKYPDVACLVGLWSYNGPAILNAVKDGGKVGTVKIVCFDEEDDVLDGVARASSTAPSCSSPTNSASRPSRAWRSTCAATSRRWPAASRSSRRSASRRTTWPSSRPA